MVVVTTGVSGEFFFCGFVGHLLEGAEGATYDGLVGAVAVQTEDAVHVLVAHVYVVKEKKKEKKKTQKEEEEEEVKEEEGC